MQMMRSVGQLQGWAGVGRGRGGAGGPRRGQVSSYERRAQGGHKIDGECDKPGLGGERGDGRECQRHPADSPCSLQSAVATPVTLQVTLQWSPCRADPQLHLPCSHVREGSDVREENGDLLVVLGHSPVPLVELQGGNQEGSRGSNSRTFR